MSFGQVDTRAGPNKSGGLQTKYSADLVFNSNEPHIIYNIPFMIGRPSALPDAYQAGKGPGQFQVATWYHPGGPTGAPWPGIGLDPRTTGMYVPPPPPELAYSVEQKAQIIEQQEAAQEAAQAPTNKMIVIISILLLALTIGGSIYFFVIED